jgi:hypothetical protein
VIWNLVFWRTFGRFESSQDATWAAQQSVIPNETEQDSGSVLSFLVGESMRATYQLCQAISDDLKRTDIDLQAGSPVQLYEVTKALTEQLNSVINKRDGA